MKNNLINKTVLRRTTRLTIKCLEHLPEGYTFVESPSPIKIVHYDIIDLPSKDASAAGQFDVLLSYNSEDRGEVKRIAEQLKERGLQPWLDEWEIRPGTLWQETLERQIKNIPSVAVFVGSRGIGPWHDLEMKAFLMEFVERQCPVIPVFLASCKVEPDLPGFLRLFHRVDFSKSEPDPISQLIWGITGGKP